MKTFPLDIGTLKEYVTYDPVTGVFTCNKACGKRPAGRVAGGISRHGYRQIAVAGRTYTAQKLAWLYMTGKWSEHDIDHINRVRTDNRFKNLREATRVENLHNTGATIRSASGVRGVYRHTKQGTRKPWRAGIMVGGRLQHLGNFYTIEEAAAARAEAEKQFL